MAIVGLFPKWLVGTFGASNERVCDTAFAVKAFRIYLCMLPSLCVDKAAFLFHQAMERAVLDASVRSADGVPLGAT